MRVNYDDPVKNLPDAFRKDTESNNYKLLQINKITTDIIESGVKNLFGALSLNNAKGKVLDDIYGSRVHLQRGALPDEQYIIRLRAKMMQNIATGAFPDLVGALAYALQCDKSEIHIVESKVPNKVNIKNIPRRIILSAGFTIADVIEMIENMLPMGVSIEAAVFSSTIQTNIYVGAALVKTFRKFTVPAAQLPDEERGFN